MSEGKFEADGLDDQQTINLSVSAVIERIRKLEAKGLIRQYTVVLDEKKLGNDLTVFVSVRLENPRCGEAFAKAASAHPNISECYYIAGDVDYLLKIVTDSSRSLELIHEDIKAMEGVAWTEDPLCAFHDKKRCVCAAGRGMSCRIWRRYGPQPPGLQKYFRQALDTFRQVDYAH